MIDILKDIFKTYKKAIIILGVFFVVLIILPKVLGIINKVSANKTPIVKIEATNDKVYMKGDKIKASDFDVKGIHKDGKKTTVDDSLVKISSSDITPVGVNTIVTVSLKDKESINTVVKVKNKRDKIGEVECGKPNLSDVKAVLYSNGELSFEGEGEIRVYKEGSFPWYNLIQDENSTINSISFEEKVTPTNINGWFMNIESLEYIENIPKSVKTMDFAFSNCVNLKHIPSLKENNNLLSTKNAFENCYSLIESPELPNSLIITDSMFYNCVKLESTGNLKNAISIKSAVSMFAGCEQLIKISFPPNLQDASSMYEGCINLKESPQFPESIRVANKTFYDNLCLETPVNIPDGCVDVSSCFENCASLSGTIVIDANPANYSSFLNNAGTARKIDLTGNSLILNTLANTSLSKSITVNGQKPDKNTDDRNNVELDSEW